jgi:CelD/BcsL family acetyltransferase involved in cellulose biosynthesis
MGLCAVQKARRPGEKHLFLGPSVGTNMAVAVRNLLLKEATPNVKEKGAGLTAVVVDDLPSLEQHRAAWEELAANALEPNVYYEPWMLLPAWRAFGTGQEFFFLLFFRANPRNPAGPPLLCGFFPLQRQRRYKGLPLSCLRLAEVGHCYLSTPLLRKDFARETLAAFFDWLAADARSAPIIEFDLFPAEGPVHQLLVDLFRARGSLSFVSDAFTRAFFRPRKDSETFLSLAVSAEKRRDLARKQRRLAELGKVDFRELEPGDDPGPWIDDFLRLEASGWKGQEGTAIGCTEAGRGYFRELARDGHRRGRLFLLGLFLNDRPIAFRCNLLAPPGSFFFKPAYDEQYSRFSPGVLLEVETIRRLHDRPEIHWMDSCTSPDNHLLNSLWPDRRTFRTIAIATNRRPGRLVVSLLPLLRWLNRRLGRYQTAPNG